MTQQSATPRTEQGECTICVRFNQDQYPDIVADAARFRQHLDQQFQAAPELFPPGFGSGYTMKDSRTSTKLQLPLRRITLKNGDIYTVRPSFVLPYMTATVDDVADALFLAKWAPLWALEQVFKVDATKLYRIINSIGRNSIVGTTIKTAEIPEHLLADEHHETLCSEKIYIATTVAAGCVLGAEVCPTASTEDLTKGYGVYRDEVLVLDPNYRPQTVNTDGWKGTQGAWSVLFPMAVILRCFLHAWLSIRDRAKNLKEQFFDLGERVWEIYYSEDRRMMGQRLRRLKDWAMKNLSGTTLEKTLDLCRKGKLWGRYYDHPEGHATSNMLDRLMRQQNGFFDRGQHFHGTMRSSNLRSRAWAILHNYWTWSPQTVKNNDGMQCPAERLNGKRYAENWLENLLIAASLNGTKYYIPKKRNN
jgi:hypothetical protein